jgi:hypothetical protein
MWLVQGQGWERKESEFELRSVHSQPVPSDVSHSTNPPHTRGLEGVALRKSQPRDS